MLQPLFRYFMFGWLKGNFVDLSTGIYKFEAVVSFSYFPPGESTTKPATQKEGMARFGVMLSSKLEKLHIISNFIFPNLRSFPFFRRGGLTTLIGKY